MGNRRLALGRLEALVEQLKRELTMGGTELQGYRRTVEAKTADYEIVEADSGKILTTEGAAGAVIFTLPTPTTALKGMWVDIVQCADQNMRVTCETADKIITQGSLVADYIENTEAALKVGAHCECVCTGTKWIVRVAGVSASYWTFGGV
mgnify:FL=1|tara:strand:- start:199 stop:648 length:450 start_codon:yes stop_codon:yes gene_type:complete